MFPFKGGTTRITGQSLWEYKFFNPYFLNMLKSTVTPVKYFFSAFILILFLGSCGKDAIDMVDCTGLAPTYTADIKAILNASCATSGCHNAVTKQSNIDLSSYGPASSESHNDRFLGCIQQKRGYNAMPQDAAKLSQDKIDLLTCWVQNGSPE